MRRKGAERSGCGKICHDRFVDTTLLTHTFIAFGGSPMNKMG